MSDQSTEKLGRVTSASVKKCTGRDWNEWIEILDHAGARAWTHPEIVAFLRKKYRLSPWWQQGVTHGFELAIGRRIEGRNAKGELSITATKTLMARGPKVWKLLASPRGMALWLRPLSPVTLKAGNAFETEDGYFGEMRTLLAGKRVRLTWQDPAWEKKSVLQIHVVPREGEKCVVVFQHDQLLDARAQPKLRSRWKAALDALAHALESG